MQIIDNIDDVDIAEKNVKILFGCLGNRNDWKCSSMHSLIAHVTLRIKEEMESAGYDQKSFATKFDKGEEWMVAKLKHGRNLTLEDIVFFSDALNVPYARFFPNEIVREVIRRISFKELIDFIGKD